MANTHSLPGWLTNTLNKQKKYHRMEVLHSSKLIVLTLLNTAMLPLGGPSTLA